MKEAGSDIRASEQCLECALAASPQPPFRGPGTSRHWQGRRLTIHPGVGTQVANAGGSLAGDGDGVAGCPRVEVDVNRHCRAGQDEDPDDGQDVRDAHKLKQVREARPVNGRLAVFRHKSMRLELCSQK